LKHNPDKDLVFGMGVVRKEIIKNQFKHQEIFHFKETWFYEGKDSVEHCNILFNDLMSFIKEKQIDK
jgi:hypothetical protein